MAESGSNFDANPVAGQNGDLQPVLDRIAAALEKRNEEAGKQKEDGGGAGGDKKGGGDKDKKDEEAAKEKDEPPGKAKQFIKSPLGILVIIVVAVLLVLVGLRIWHYESTHVSTDDAYTSGHVHQISPRVNGLVLELWVDDNQHVEPGDLLIKLDPKDYDVACARAQADLAQSQAQVLQVQGQLLQAEAGIEQAKAQVAQARAQVDQAGANYEVAGVNYGRTSTLYGKDLRAVAKADVDTTKSTLDANKAALDASKANSDAAQANFQAAVATKESRAGDLAAAKAAVDVAKVNLDNAKLQLSYCWVLAPCAGRVSRRTVETGMQLSTGQAIMAITPDVVWVLANYKETQLENIRVGQTVKIPIDSFPKHPFVGRVDSIQNGSGATYSLLPPDNATGNFTKIVQRVPVKITFNPDSIKGFEDLVVPGLSCEPVIDLSSTSDRGDYVAKGQTAPPRDRNQR